MLPNPKMYDVPTTLLTYFQLSSKTCIVCYMVYANINLPIARLNSVVGIHDNLFFRIMIMFGVSSYA
jgi:hypothetical protein